MMKVQVKNSMFIDAYDDDDDDSYLQLQLTQILTVLVFYDCLFYIIYINCCPYSWQPCDLVPYSSLKSVIFSFTYFLSGCRDRFFFATFLNMPLICDLYYLTWLS